MKTQWLSDQEEHVWRAWMRVNALLPAELGQQIQAHGLGLQDYELLVALTDAEADRMRMSDLADAVHWDRSRLSHHIGRMERRGLVAREHCSEDRRGAYVAVTEEGRRAIEAAAPAHVEGVRDLVFNDLTGPELAALGRVFSRLVNRLEPGVPAPAE